MTVIVAIYFVCAILLTIYGINIHVLVQMFKHRYPPTPECGKALRSYRYDVPIASDNFSQGDVQWPVITTQLPIFNERHVVDRLIDALAGFHYPAKYHEIQVLDDSTDETRNIVADKVRRLRQKGVDIHHITRRDRLGFKGGALREGLSIARGELVAIFDADFLPPPDFLLRTVPHFLNRPKLGLVQARWGHLNQNDSWLTRLEAIGINGHFMVEQGARSGRGLFMNFNGTAGVLRRSAILDAGNWQDDTLTEDMDLSYRMQLCGWQCRYLIDLVAPAEIPRDLNAFKSQQFRWAKGSTQTALKLLPHIWRSPCRPFVKFQAFMHMTHYIIHPLMLILALLAPLLLMQNTSFLTGSSLFCFGGMVLISCTGPSRMYLVAEHSLGRPYWSTLKMLPFMVCFGCGLAVNNSRAVVEALVGKSSPFVRTPKSGGALRSSYRIGKSSLVILELVVGLWCLFGMGLYFYSRHFLIGHFLLLYALGFLYIGGLSWWHARENAAS